MVGHPRDERPVPARRPPEDRRGCTARRKGRDVARGGPGRTGAGSVRPGHRGRARDGRAGAVGAQRAALVLPDDPGRRRAVRRPHAAHARGRPRRPGAAAGLRCRPVQPPARADGARCPPGRRAVPRPRPARPRRRGPASGDRPRDTRADTPARRRAPPPHQPPPVHRRRGQRRGALRTVPGRRRGGGVAARRAARPAGRGRHGSRSRRTAGSWPIRRSATSCCTGPEPRPTGRTACPPAPPGRHRLRTTAGWCATSPAAPRGRGCRAATPRTSRCSPR